MASIFKTAKKTQQVGGHQNSGDLDEISDNSNNDNNVIKYVNKNNPPPFSKPQNKIQSQNQNEDQMFFSINTRINKQQILKDNQKMVAQLQELENKLQSNGGNYEQNVIQQPKKPSLSPNQQKDQNQKQQFIKPQDQIVYSQHFNVAGIQSQKKNDTQSKYGIGNIGKSVLKPKSNYHTSVNQSIIMSEIQKSKHQIPEDFNTKQIQKEEGSDLYKSIIVQLTKENYKIHDSNYRNKIKQKINIKLDIVQDLYANNPRLKYKDLFTRGLYKLSEQQRQVNDGLISCYAGQNEEQFLKCKIAICITMYNEDKQQYDRTIRGVYDNIKEFNKIGISNHEILIFIVQDGITKIYKDDINGEDQSMYKEYIRTMNDPDKSGNYQIFDNRVDFWYEKLSNIQYMISESKKVNPQKGIEQFITVIKQLPYWDIIHESEYLNKFNKIYQQKLKESNQNHQRKKDQRDIEAANLQAAIKQFVTELQNEVAELQNKALLIQSRNRIINNDHVQERIEKELEDIKKRQTDLIKKQDRNIQLDVKLSMKLEGQTSQNLIGDSTRKLNEFDDLVKRELDNLKNVIINSDYMYQFFIVKFGNFKKLNSHLWFFSGICNIVNPEVCILLDCGAKPEKDALLKMYLAIKIDDNVGGVCGFMGLQEESLWDFNELSKQGNGLIEDIFFNLFSIQKAQKFEYCIAHLYDKALESATDFIHVLPGAFSGYRWDALRQDERGHSCLDPYLKTELYTSEKDKQEYESVQEANKYLAEDRILCLKIYAKQGKKFKLKYLPDCNASVDPVTDLLTLCGQRRRWINGSWFALEYVLEQKQQYEVQASDHTWWELFKFKINMFFSKYSQVLAYFIIAFFFTFNNILIEINLGQTTIISQGFVNSFKFSWLFTVTYFVCIVFLITYSLNYAANSHRSNTYYTIAMVLGLLTLVTTVLTIIISYKLLVYSQERLQVEFPQNSEDYSIDLKYYVLEFNSLQLYKYSLFYNVFLMIVPLLFQLNRVVILVKSVLDYTFFAPTYIHMFLIYAFCRVDDLTWGTKGVGEAAQSSALFEKNAVIFKYTFSGTWLLWNLSLIMLFAVILSIDTLRVYFMVSFGIIITLISTIKTLWIVWEYLKYYFPLCGLKSQMKKTAFKIYLNNNYSEKGELKRQENIKYILAGLENSLDAEYRNESDVIGNPAKTEYIE